jgi:quercetin dioxygenase-like cupin family protein
MDAFDIRTLDIQPRKPVVLRSDDESRVIAINLPQGELLQEHQVHERAFLVVADGEVEIVQEGHSTTAGPGFVAHFEPNERREVRATRDARLVLILAPWPGKGHPSDPSQRVGATA